MRVARSNNEIEGLAARMAVAEEDAYAEFAVTFGPRLKAFFIRKGVARADAEELSVSCVTDIALKVNKYKLVRPGGFEAWVFTVARHLLIDWLRSRPDTEPLTDDFSSPPSGEDDYAAPDFVIAVAVREAMAQLSAADQSIIRLRHLESESTYEEIADYLGITPEAARVRHFRAMKRLKPILEADERISRYLGLGRK
jgi:RNA polymerase sigma factor (sigma-70 family)